MNISELSIRRPVLATVMTLIILLFGFIGYNSLGVREYPSVDNPIISVSCSYPGANADVIENQITEPLEQNINGIPGIRSLSSVSSQGSSRITVEFELSVDLETAANDVRDKVSRAQRYLPRDCDPPTVSKADADATPNKEQGEYYVAQRHAFAPQEEQRDEQDEQLRQGVEMEAAFAQVPHQYHARQRHRIEQGRAEEEGARRFEELFDQYGHFGRKRHRTRLICRLEGGQGQAGHQVAKEAES